MTETPPPITRPNGKLYRPRTIRVVGWDWEWGDVPWQVAVLGTHNIALARSHAPRGFHCPRLVRPQLSWMRKGMRDGEPFWVVDDVRGAACVVFNESDDPEETP